MDDCSLDMWTPYKHLCNTIEKCIVESNDASFGTLQATTNKYKQNFLNVLKNPPKNDKSRKILQKSESEGIKIAGVEYHSVPKKMVDEALIVSDMYDLDELMALDLLTTAQYQIPSYPGLSRGLVAVLLYYDGHKALATALRTIMQARAGFQWTVDISSNIPEYLAKFSDELVSEGLLDKVIGALKRLDLVKEVEKLQQNRALGDPKHHHAVITLFEDIRQLLADIIFLYAAQAGLYKHSLFQLINFLRTLKIEGDAAGGIDNVTLTLQMAFLFAIDVGNISKRENSDELLQRFPLVCESGALEDLIAEIKNPNKTWECSGLATLTQFALGISVAALRNSNAVTISRSVTDEDDALVTLALTKGNEGAFSFLLTSFMRNDLIHNEEFYMRRMHNLFTDFIVLMPLKVKELRVRADELAKISDMFAQEGLTNRPNGFEHNFEMMLNIITRLYRNDPLNLKLHLDYWFDDSIKTSRTTSMKKFSQQVSLFKFVKQMGDSLPPSLFVAYLEFIGSLSSCPDSARQSFKMFKNNDVSTLTWDHFFKSFHRYYENLKLEQQPSRSDTIYRNKSMYPKGINPMELQGLQAVLYVIRKIAEQDDISRISFCENPDWACISIFLGLVTCSIDLNLKANIVLTLAAMAKNPEIANAIWRNLELTQIIPTVPSTAIIQNRGVIAELDEIESKNEEFPLTTAMLTLLDTLVNSPMPRLLGVGSRTPGFDPYLNYILRSVFLRFSSRSYKKHNDKWQIGNMCVQLCLKFLKQYDPNVEDFTGLVVQTEDGGRVQICPHPGFHIMINACSSSEFLRVILDLISKGCEMLDLYKDFPGKKMFEHLILSCLELLNTVLEMQTKFLSLLTKSNSDKILIPLHHSLTGINPHTGNPDHLVNIAKYVTYNAWLPNHTLMAVQILLQVTSHPIKHSIFLPFFTLNDSIQTSIRHGFVETLECEDRQWFDGSTLNVTSKIKETIMKILIQCLQSPGFNLSHFLLGFNSKNIKKTILQSPGSGYPRTCFHSILSILDKSLLYRKDKAVLKIHPQLIQLSYNIIYNLCANLNTADSVLRFLRSSQDFLQQHMALFPFKTYDKVTEFACMAWILKISAIELRVISSMGHMNQFEGLARFFLYNNSNNFTISHQRGISRRGGNEEITSLISTRLFQLMNVIEFEKESPTIPDWQFFDGNQVLEVLRQCETTMPLKNVKQISVHKLASILQEELNSMQGSSTSGQRQMIQREIQELLLYATRLNEYKVVINSQIQYFDAWRKLCNIYFIVAPSNILPFQFRFSLLMELIRSLLQMVSEAELQCEEIKLIASKTILLLITDLRQCVKNQKRILNIKTRELVLLQIQTHETYSSEIFGALKNWIVFSGNSSKKTKVNLITCFLSFLHFCIDDDEPEVKYWLEDFKSKPEFYDIESKSQSLTYIFKSKLATADFAEPLFKIFSEDATSSNGIWKMTALSGLNVMIDSNPKCVDFISSYGYLKSIVQSIIESDTQLMKVVHQECMLAPLFVYETEMALLCKIASSEEGAKSLLYEKVLISLAGMDVFSNHPTVELSNVGNANAIDFLPESGGKYLKLFTPVLKLCNTIIMSVGCTNEEAMCQIMHLIFSMNESVSLVLRSASPTITPEYMEELLELVSVVSPVFGNFFTSKLRDDHHSEKTVYVHKIHKLLFSFYSNFRLTEPILKRVGDSFDSELNNPVARSHGVVKYLQVIIQILSYTQTIATGNKYERYISNCIFQPTLNELTKSKKDTTTMGTANTHELDLGIMVKYILNGISCYLESVQFKSKWEHKLESVPAMTTDEIRQMLSSERFMSAASDCKNEASLYIRRLILEVERQLNTYFIIIETSLYLLWAHLDYFILQGIPQSGISKLNTSIPKIGECGRVCTAEQLSNIKQTLVPIFNDGFSSNLAEITKNRTPPEKGHVEALLRRIKKIIQFT